MHRTIRSVAVVLVLLVLVTGAAQARTFTVRTPSGFFDALWQWVSRHLGRTTVGEKEGGMMDPNGSPLQAPPPPLTEEGSDMDPNG